MDALIPDSPGVCKRSCGMKRDHFNQCETEGSAEDILRRLNSSDAGPDLQIDGLVENNVIDMDSTCADTGIQVVGDPGGVQTKVSVNKNTITGAYLGVDVDFDVVAVNFFGTGRPR